MFARLLLGGALGMALVTLSASANAQSNGRVDHTDRIGSHFNAVSDESGNGPLLTFAQKNPKGHELDDHRHDDDGHHRHRSHHHHDD
jgi:hypothetical protein